MNGQSDFARAKRIVRGACPTHGIELQQSQFFDGKGTFICPRKDCDYTVEVKPGSELWRILFNPKAK